MSFLGLGIFFASFSNSISLAVFRVEKGVKKVVGNWFETMPVRVRRIREIKKLRLKVMELVCKVSLRRRQRMVSKR